MEEFLCPECDSSVRVVKTTFYYDGNDQDGEEVDATEAEDRDGLPDMIVCEWVCDLEDEQHVGVEKFIPLSPREW